MLTTKAAAWTQCRTHRQACGRWSRPRTRLPPCAYLPLRHEPADVASMADMTKGSRLASSGWLRGLERVLWCRAKPCSTKSDLNKCGACQEHRLLCSEPPREPFRALRRLFNVSEFGEWWSKWVLRSFFRSGRLRTAREPRRSRVNISCYRPTEWPSSTGSCA